MPSLEFLPSSQTVPLMNHHRLSTGASDCLSLQCSQFSLYFPVGWRGSPAWADPLPTLSKQFLPACLQATSLTTHAFFAGRCKDMGTGLEARCLGSSLNPLLYLPPTPYHKLYDFGLLVFLNLFVFYKMGGMLSASQD